MAELTATTMQGSGQRTVTVNTLTSSDTLTHLPGNKQLLVLVNTTAGLLTVNIKGSDASNMQIGDIGNNTALSAGYDANVAAGFAKVIDLDESRLQLASATGQVNLTGGTGLLAILLNN